MKRIFLFTVTNMAVLAVLTLVLWALEAAGLRLGRNGFGALLVVAAIAGIGGAVLSLALSKWTARRMGVRPVEPEQSEREAWLLATVARLAARAGIRTPEVGIFDSQDMNAFATGARRDAALLAVSSRLLDLPRPQIEAVLGHEISHIASGDMVTLALLQGVLNTFVVFLSRVVGSLVSRSLLRNERGDGGLSFVVTSLLAQLLLGIGAGMIVNWYSRRREFQADRGGATLAGLAGMIGALESLRGPAQPLPPRLPALGLTADTGRWMRIFSSHPTLDERIAALRNLQEFDDDHRR